MSDGLSLAMANLGHIGERITGVIQADPGLRKRGQGMVEALRWLCPNCGLSACLLEQDGESIGCVVDAAGAERTEWATAFQEMLRTANGVRPTLLPTGVTLPEHSLILEWIDLSGQRAGLLAVAMPEAVENRGLFETCVALSSALLAMQLAAEARQLQLAAEVADLAWLADLGEMAGPMIHEFNNFLNVCLLNVRILEMRLGEEFHADLSSIRLQGAEMAGLVKHLQHYRQKNRPNPKPIDLNRVLGELRIEGRQNHIRIEPASAVPPVHGSAADLKRLLRILLANRAAANTPGGEIGLRSGSKGGKVWLRIEDDGPAVATDQLPHFFESQAAARPGVNHLELAACKSLVRRLQGSLRVENRAVGGLAIIVELPAS